MKAHWWRRIQRWRRLRRAEKLKEQNPLREFLYLDEASVYSLYASRFGPIAREFTDSLQVTDQTERSAEAELTVGVKGKVGRKNTEGRVSNSQVLRKSIIQTTFKEWVDFERQHLALSPATGPVPHGAITEKNIIDASRTDADRHFVLPANEIVRGGLIEVDVILETADIYKVSSVFSSMASMFRQSPALFPNTPSNLGEIESFVDVVDQFLVGLIPLECRLKDYVSVEINGETWIVHNGLLVDVPQELRDSIKPLYLVALTEIGGYWKDVRRILFSKPPVRMLARIEGARIVHDWNAVKLVDLLADFSPTLANEVGSGMRMAVDAVRAVEGTQRRSAGAVRAAREGALRRYAELVTEKLGLQFDPADIELDTLVQGNIDINSAEAMRCAYDEVAALFVRRNAGHGLDTRDSAELRYRASVDNGLTMSGELSASLPAPRPHARNRRSARFLDCEIVAIYW